MHASPGQASIEWLGLLALLAAVIALGLGAAASQGVFVGRTITRQVARALCLVGGGDCRRDQEPCTTSGHSDTDSTTIDLAIVKLGGGDVVLVEHRSDGTVAITRAPSGVLGLDAGYGLGAQVKLGRLDVSVGGEVEASILASRHTGKTWVVANEGEAAAMLDRLAQVRHAPKLPPPDIEYEHGDLSSSLGVSVAAGVGKDAELASAGADVAFDREAGSRIDHRNGHRTYYAHASWNGKAGAKVAGGVLAGTAAGHDGETYEVEVDASGRPLDLRVVTTGPYRGAADLPSVASSEQGLLDVRATRGDRTYVVTAHLDLTDPGNLAAARGLISSLTDGGMRFGAPAAASAALRRRIEQGGTIEAQVIQHDDHHRSLALSGTAAAVKLGVDLQHASSTTQLLAAASRGLDGQWLPREDCITRAWPVQR